MSNVSLSRKPLDVMTPTDPAPLKKEKWRIGSYISSNSSLSTSVRLLLPRERESKKKKNERERATGKAEQKHQYTDQTHQ